MEVKYQVFVSSTYEDLKDERKVRCIDVAVMLGVARATASRMIGLLIEKKLLWPERPACALWQLYLQCVKCP